MEIRERVRRLTYEVQARLEALTLLLRPSQAPDYFPGRITIVPSRSAESAMPSSTQRE